ncbi:MAG: glycosyltransferase family 4 protein [Acidobacteria bacterium]|nr:glycosyltransferase family 4 protein [Acidobacteriota bacterium]
MARTAPTERFVLCYRSNPFFRVLSSPRPAPNCSRRLLAGPLYFLLQNGVSVFHGLGQRLPPCRFRRTVTTFHDLFQITGDYFAADFRRRMMIPIQDAAARSDHIIAVSHFTAEQVAAHLRYPQSQITVIHHGVEPIPEFPPEQLQTFRQLHSLDAPFLLHVGAIETRKNIPRLIEALEGLTWDGDLVLAGSPSYGFEQIQERIQRSSARNRIRLVGYVDCLTLAKLYRTATALVFPTLEEGFGLPVLEAMSAGLPVVSSNCSALPEIAGDAALLVNPQKPEEIQHAIEQVLTDPECRNRLVQEGFRRVASFRWEKAAAATLEVYKALA